MVTQFTDIHVTRTQSVNTLRLRQNGCQFTDDIFKFFFLNEYVWISIEISMEVILRGSINNIPASCQMIAWHRPGDEPLSELLMIRLSTHICVTRHQWVKLQNWNTGTVLLFQCRRHSSASFIWFYIPNINTQSELPSDWVHWKIRCLIFKSCETLKLWVWVKHSSHRLKIWQAPPQNCYERPVKFESDWTTLNPYFTILDCGRFGINSLRPSDAYMRQQAFHPWFR